jgi:hypothetical protein
MNKKNLKACFSSAGSGTGIVSRVRPDFTGYRIVAPAIVSSSSGTGSTITRKSLSGGGQSTGCN